MDEREQRIRERAHRLWEEEGRPDGRAADHWFQAKEIVAIEEGRPETLKPIGEAGEPAEPIEALLNVGEFPTLTDQGEMQIPGHPEPQAAPVAGPAAKSAAKDATKPAKKPATKPKPKVQSKSAGTA